MNVNLGRPLAENVYNVLSNLLPRRVNCKVWEEDLMAQAALELERSDPATTAKDARFGLVYVTQEPVGVLPAGTRLLRVFRGWEAGPRGDDPDWKRYTVGVAEDTRIELSLVQSL